MYKTTLVAVLMVVLAGVLYVVNAQKSRPLTPVVKDNQTFVDPVFPSWQKFLPLSRRFSVFVPSVPVYVKDAVSIPDSNQKALYEVYISEKVNGAVFMVGVLIYPKEVDELHQEDVLRLVVQNLISGQRGHRLSNIKGSLFHDYRAINFTVTSPQFVGRGKAFMVGRVIYILNYMVRKADFDEREYEHFIDSFTILYPEKIESGET